MTEVDRTPSPKLEPKLLLPFETLFDGYYSIIRCKNCNGVFDSNDAIEAHYMSNSNTCSQPTPSIYDKVLAGLNFYAGLNDNEFETMDKNQKMPGGLDQEEQIDNVNTVNHGHSHRYGLRPRGAILRVRNPPSWVRHPQAKELLDEYNLQGAFREEIDAAYQTKKEEVTVVRKMMNLTFKFLVRLWRKYGEDIVVVLVTTIFFAVFFSITGYVVWIYRDIFNSVVVRALLLC